MEPYVSYLANALSLQMFDLSQSTDLHIFPMSIGSVREFSRDGIKFESAIGHPDTAAVVSDLVGQEVEARRISIKLTDDDMLIVAQLVGGRLPEGATRLPDGFELKFFGVSIKK